MREAVADAAADGAAWRQSAVLFAALGDPTRLQLVLALGAGGQVSIVQLTTGTGITRQAISKHLRVLADAGLVRDVKVGRERRWQLEPAHLDQARRSLDLITQRWDNTLARLKQTVER